MSKMAKENADVKVLSCPWFLSHAETRLKEEGMGSDSDSCILTEHQKNKNTLFVKSTIPSFHFIPEARIAWKNELMFYYNARYIF